MSTLEEQVQKEVEAAIENGDTNKPKRKRKAKATVALPATSEASEVLSNVEPIERKESLAYFRFVPPTSEPIEVLPEADEVPQQLDHYNPFGSSTEDEDGEITVDWRTKLKYILYGSMGGALVSFAAMAYALMIKEQREEAELAAIYEQRSAFIAQELEKRQQQDGLQQASPLADPPAPLPPQP